LKTLKTLLIFCQLFYSAVVLADKKIIIDSKYALSGKEIYVKDDYLKNDVLSFITEGYRLYGYEDVKVIFGENDTIEVLDDDAEIYKIFISGNKQYEEKELIRILNLDEMIFSAGWMIKGKSLVEGLNGIKNHYHDNGLPRVRLKSRVKDGELFIHIDEGVVVRVLETEIKSDITNIELFERIMSEFEGGKRFSNKRVRAVLSEIKNYLDNNGFVDGVINVENKEVGDNGVILVIKIKAGEQYTFGKISLSGWELDNEYKYKYIHPGDIYSLNKIKNEVDFINNKKLFRSIIPDVTKIGNNVNVNINLEKMKTGIIMGGASLNGPTPNIYIKIKEDNFLNKGITADLSVSGNSKNLELLSKLRFDNNSEFIIRINDYSEVGGDSRKYSVSWHEQKSLADGFYYGVGLNSYVNCVRCGGFGVQVNLGVKWNNINDAKNPSSGNSGYAEAIGIFNEAGSEYFVNGKYINYVDAGDGIVLKNEIFVSMGVNGNYFEQEPNAFILRGINQGGLEVGETKSLVFKNKMDLYKKIEIFGNEFSFGPYLDIIGTHKDFDNSRLIAGGSVNFKTGIGNVGLYYGMPFGHSGMDDTVGGIMLNNVF
jgi:outer membrane protein assembly factor BamA